MEGKAFIIMCILIAKVQSQSTTISVTDSTSSLSSVSTTNTSATSTATTSSTTTTAPAETFTTTAGVTTTAPQTTVTTTESSTTATTTNAPSTILCSNPCTKPTTLTPTGSSSVTTTLTESSTISAPVTSAQSTASTASTEPTAPTVSTASTVSSTSAHTTASTETTASTTSTTSTTSTATTAKIVPEVLTVLEFRSNDTFIIALSDNNSEEFKSRAKLVKDQIEPIYKIKYDNFLRVIVLGFSEGSIITSTRLAFSLNQAIPSVGEISNTLLTAVGNGGVNLLNIIPQSISVNGSASATTVTPAATTATTASGGLKIESSLLQATCLVIMSKILKLFL